MTDKLKNYFLIFCIFISALIPEVFAGSYSKTMATVQSGYRNMLSFSPDNPYFPIIILIGFLILIGTIYFPKFGLFTMLFFIMISTDLAVGKGDKSRDVSIRYEDIILLLVSAGWILNRARTRTLASIKECSLYKPILAMIAIIVLATIIGYFQETVHIRQGFLYSMKRLEYFWIFFMAYNLMETKMDALISIRIFLVVSSFVAIIGIFQFYIFPYSELAMGGSTGTAGFGRANTLADFYLIIIGVVFGLFIKNSEKKWEFIYISLFAIFMAALIMTKSRGAYVSIPPLLFVIAFISRSKKMLIMVVSTAILIALFYAGGFLMGTASEMLMKQHQGDIKEQFESIGEVAQRGPEADSSFNARYTAWINYFPEMMRYPILGHGVGSLPLYMFDCHYVAELYDTGFLGLGVFLYLNLCVFLAVLKFYYYTNDNFSKGLSLGFMGGHAGMLVHAVTVTNFYTIINMEAFWFILAIIMLLSYLQRQERIPG